MSLTETQPGHQPIQGEAPAPPKSRLAQAVLDNGVKATDPNPKQAYGDKKVPVQLCPPAALAEMATSLREGAFKYGEWNFRNTKIELMTYVGAIMRHCLALADGEWYDDVPVINKHGVRLNAPPKSHVAGILGSAAILADSYHNGNVIDNRPRKGNISATFEQLQLRDEE